MISKTYVFLLVALAASIHNCYGGEEELIRASVSDTDEQITLNDPTWLQAMYILEENDANHLTVTAVPQQFENSSFMVIEIPSGQSGTLKIMDMLGNSILPYPVRFEDGNHALQIGGDGWADGIYFYVLKTDTQKVTGRVVKGNDSDLDRAQVSPRQD